MESAERLLSQLRCGNIVEEDSFSMSILDCPPLTIKINYENTSSPGRVKCSGYVARRPYSKVGRILWMKIH